MYKFIVVISLLTCLFTTFVPGVDCDGSVADKDTALYFDSLRNEDVTNTTTTLPTANVTVISTVQPSRTPNTTDNHYAVGFIAAGVAVIFFGSNFVPVKKFETGDGMFFQWILVSGIWIVGLIVNMIRHVPTFHPLAMLGGFLWATGNVTVVPIIKTIGLGLGMCIWGSLNLLMGWASGRFGWFGLKPEKPYNEVLNYVGVGLAVFSVLIYLMVQSDVSQQSTTKDKSDQDEDIQPILSTDHVQVLDEAHLPSPSDEENSDASWVDKFSPAKRRIIGCGLAVIAGCLYGLNFAPCIWIQDNVDGASTNGLDYVFAHFCGIYATGTLYFTIYCILMKNKPKIFPKLILPALVSGVMWAIAQSAWFIANFTLQESVSFPIITTGPSIIASIWGVVVFKEIKGKRNILILMLAFIITIAGAVLSGLSKIENL